MKLIISILLSYNVYASNLISIKSSYKNLSNALYIKRTLTKKYSIPESLIELDTKECEYGKEGNIEFCINEEKELIIYKKNSELVSSLKIFNRSY